MTSIYDGLYFSFANTFLRRISQADLTGTIIYDWLVDKSYRIERLQESYIFEELIMTMVRDWATQDLLNQFNAIQWEALSNRQKDVIARAKVRIQSNIDWQTKNYDTIATWLSNNY